MRLKSIKLAGFKSFVDPTTVIFPGNLSGVVGPNGCGKSNIIDAVRWVMGESSAKYLRGESMADVIFNGSSARKPAGQASIELHFDNSAGQLGGLYAQYHEIVIRRQVNLEGHSVYYLNGSVCRRRDITDIFLGTGLGPRSYAIIEQGTISRLIEAKPEELRVYLEEAAGISKYKERRRETELRLQHTRDNLARLNDLRDELQKQLDRLSKQAATAEKYQSLKEKEHTFRAQLLVLRAKTIQAHIAHEQQQVARLVQSLETQNTEWQSISDEKGLQQQAHVVAADEVQTAQHEYYECNTTLARIEQTLQHHQEKQKQYQDALLQAQQEGRSLDQQVKESEASIEKITLTLESLLPELEASKTSAQTQRKMLQQLEDNTHEEQSRWDQFHQAAAMVAQKAQVEQTRIQHLDKQVLQRRERLQRLQEERESYAQKELPLEIQGLKEQLTEIAVQIQTHQQQVSSLQTQLQNQREQYHIQQKKMDEMRTHLQSLRGRQASLQALQEAALGKKVESTSQWLQRHQLTHCPRLAQRIQVEQGWELALEVLLREYLEAICVENVSSLLPSLNLKSLANVILIEDDTSAVHLKDIPSCVSDLVPLATKIAGPNAIHHVIRSVYVAEDMAQVLTLLPQLETDASIITKEGVWIGKGWLRLHSREKEKSGVLVRERELLDIQKQLDEQVNLVEQHQQHLLETQRSLSTFENEREALQKILSGLITKQGERNTQLKVQETQWSQTQQRKAQINQEIKLLTAHFEQETSELSEAKKKWEALKLQIDEDVAQRQVLHQKRECSRQELQAMRQQTQASQQRSHQLATQIEVQQAQLTAANQHSHRLKQQLEVIGQKQQHLQKELSHGEEPEKRYSSERHAQQLRQKSAEQLLQDKRSQLSALEAQMSKFDKALQATEHERMRLRTNLEQQRLQLQAYQVKEETLLEQLKEMHCHFEETSQGLPEEATEKVWEEQLGKTIQRIDRLGPINLAAISEHHSQAERKNYLDQQHNDLVEALTILEEAIRKIDKETRARFKEVYNKVNDGFQALFPRIFGGGQAYLELTAEDLLQTGVNVIARPPGKRNSTIHLLSGGEKALTAIALVFAIFQLNPAPFCMLDEVDAPLDDANIGRFCSLVKEMSKSVQFIFISHNKLAIEMAEHLLGVTMHEPGVSRLVAVDVVAAMEMAVA